MMHAALDVPHAATQGGNPSDSTVSHPCVIVAGFVHVSASHAGACASVFGSGRCRVGTTDVVSSRVSGDVR